MFKSTNFTDAERISLAKELAVIGVDDTPLSSILLAKGVEKATSTIYTWREKSFSHDEDISAEEGSETTVFQKSAKRELHNVLQILKKAASVSGSALAMKNTQFSEEISDRLFELKINMEKQLINSLKDTGEVSGIRKMSGLIEFADPSNVVNVTGAVTEDTVKEIMRNLWDQSLVGGKYFALVNADIKEQIDAIYKDRYNYNDVTTEFGLTVSAIRTNYGTLNMILDKFVPQDKIVTFNDNYTSLAFLREPAFEPLAKVGDSVRGQVVGEVTLKVASPKAVGVATVTPQA